MNQPQQNHHKPAIAQAWQPHLKRAAGTWRNLRTVAVLCALVLAFCIQGAPTAQAATITADGTTCTIYDAITAANTDTATGGCAAGSGADTIVLSDITYTLTTGTDTGDNVGTALPITSMITIEGNGATLMRDSGASDFRIFRIFDGGDLTLNNATVSGGTVITDGGGIKIDRDGNLALNNSTITNNSAQNASAIVVIGTLTVVNSTISGNSGFRGGAIGIAGVIDFPDFPEFNQNPVATLINSTVVNNSATSTTGGIFNVGTLTLQNTLVAGNSDDSFPGVGTDVHNEPGFPPFQPPATINVDG